jgi:ribonucleoside-diphosphate reductase alpha chain
LKTGMYYLRTKAAADAIKFTVEAQEAAPKEILGNEDELILERNAVIASEVSCSLDNPDACEACGS